MRIAFVTKPLAELDGGSQRSAQTLIERLTGAGHRVAAFAHTVPAAPPFECTQVAAPDELEPLLRRLRPDAVLTQLQWSPAAVAAARRLDVPAVFFSRLGECLAGADLVVFNSAFCAARFAALGERSLVLAPLVEPPPAAPPAAAGERDVVMMVNPIRLKGGQRLVEIARLMPDLDFLAVGGWWGDPAADGVDLRAVANIEHRPPLDDLAPLWRRARALLVPSVWPEPAGRVIVEACAAGVPVICSGVGGTGEMLGEAGVVVAEPDDPRRWAAAIRELLGDEARWAELAARGVERARAYGAETGAALGAFLERLECLEPDPAAPAPRLLVPAELRRFPELMRAVFEGDAAW